MSCDLLSLVVSEISSHRRWPHLVQLLVGLNITHARDQTCFCRIVELVVPSCHHLNPGSDLAVY